MVIVLLALLGVAYSNSPRLSGIRKSGVSSNSQALNYIPSVLMTNENDTYYVVNVNIGTPPVTFRLAVDTGSNVTWVKSAACPGCFNSTASYNSSKSSTSYKVYSNGVASYEDGSSVSGPGYSDVVKISNLTANITFLAATSTSLHFTNFYADGILGLGYYPQVTKGSPSIINALVAAGQIASPTFSLFYSDDIFVGKLKATLNLGMADFSLTNSSYSNYSVLVENVDTASGLWQFYSSNVEFDNNTVSNETLVVLDSAQEWIFAPSDSYATIVNVLVKAGFVQNQFYYSKKCNSSSGLPSIYIGYNYTQYLQIPSYRYIQLSGTKGNYTCYAYIFDSGDNTWYIGDSLFRTYYTTFYYQNSSIYFSPSAWLPNTKIKYHSSSSDDDDSLSGGAIAGIVIGCIVGVALIAAIVWWVLKKRGRSHNVDSMGKPLQEVSLHA